MATLNVCADDEQSYQLLPIPALEKDADAPPEKLWIGFAVAKITVLGSGLKSVERAIQKYDLKFVKLADRRYAATLKTYVAAVTITFTEEKS